MNRWMIQAALMAVAMMFVGCGNGPKSSKDPVEVVAVPAAPVVIPATHDEVAEVKTAIDELKESVDQVIEKFVVVPEAPVIIPASQEKVDARLKDLESLIGSLQTIFATAHQNVGDAVEKLKEVATATQTNTEATNATLDKHTSQLASLDAKANNIDENVADLLKQFESLRDTMAAPAAAVPQKLVPVPTPAPSAPPKRIDAPPKEQADRHTAAIRVDGEYLPVDQFIKTWFKGMWTHRGTKIDDHLFDTHAVDPRVLAMLDNETKEKLHSAIHEKERAEGVRRSVVRSKVETATVAPAAPAKPAVALPAPSGPSMNCPNGKCPHAQPSNGIVWQQTQRATKQRSKGRPTR